LEREESVALVRRALKRMAPELRAVLTLIDVEGIEYEAAAEALDWPLGTVRSRLCRARDELRARLMKKGVTA
jgi:DNA-directed RNA polymerase specialized sigma24 family protein